MGSNQNAMETNTAFPHSCYAAVQQMSGSTAELTPSTAVCCVAVLCAVLLSGSTARMAAAVRSPQDRPGTQHSRGVAVKKSAHHRAPLQRNHPRRRRSPTPLPPAGRGSGARPPPPPPPSLSSAAAELTAAAAELRERHGCQLRAHLHRHQARRRAAGAGGGDHQTLRAEGLPPGGHEVRARL